MSIHLGPLLLIAFVTALVSLLVTESYQTTPWLADKLMRWSVRLRYANNSKRATIREEELISLLGELPTLFKLPTAGGFFLRALAYRLANRRSRTGLAVKRDALLLPAFYLLNCLFFSTWQQLGDVAIKPWVAFVWLYGLVMLVPLVWRDRAPVTVFAIQWVLTVAAWPIQPYFTPIVGIPVALYAVSVHRSRKISLFALLASIIPMGLDAAVAFRVHSTQPQLQAFIPNAIVLAFVAVGAWWAGRGTQVSQQHVQHRTEPRAGHRLAVKLDALLLPAFYLLNCLVFSTWQQLGDVAIKPWVAFVWLYGLVMLVPLVWRDRAPVTVFAIQWVLTVAAWPIQPHFTPIVGIPVALYAVSVHRSRKISLFALLASIIPMGLDAAVAFRVYSTQPQQLQAFIPNAILLAFVAVGAWWAGRMTRVSQQNAQRLGGSRQIQPDGSDLDSLAPVPLNRGSALGNGSGLR